MGNAANIIPVELLMLLSALLAASVFALSLMLKHLRRKEYRQSQELHTKDELLLASMLTVDDLREQITALQQLLSDEDDETPERKESSP